MEKSFKGNNSYSDLFEDFFRADAGAEAVTTTNTTSASAADLFEGLIPNDNNKQAAALGDSQFSSQAGLNDFFLNQQLQQFQSQQASMNPFYQSAAQMPLYAFAPSIPVASGIQKPGFVRNRTRKNMRQKSVATAVKASHMLGSVSQAGSGYPLIQNYQPQIADIPYYQVASQIPSFQPPQLYTDNQQSHPIQQIPQQSSQQPPLLLAKSPSTAPPLLLRSSKNPSSPHSASARSPNGTSSDYVKLRLQQKIRSRMVSKGQIPPNPTEEELRLCGVQIPGNSQLSQHQLPTPKSSPQQIPRAFDQTQFMPVPAVPAMCNNRSQPQQSAQDELLKYLDLTDYSEQKDPLALPTTQINPLKQQQQNNNDFFYNQIQQQQAQQSQLDANNVAQTTANYDQFFSDFILY